MTTPEAPVPICEYNQKILHLPTDPKGSVLEVYNLIQQKVTLKLELKDGRVVIGTFTAFDKFGNFAITNAVEEFRDEKRNMQMVIVPLDYIVKLYSGKPNEEKTD